MMTCKHKSADQKYGISQVLSRCIWSKNVVFLTIDIVLKKRLQSTSVFFKYDDVDVGCDDNDNCDDDETNVILVDVFQW